MVIYKKENVHNSFQFLSKQNGHVQTSVSQRDDQYKRELKEAFVAMVMRLSHLLLWIHLEINLRVGQF